jgi:hypothetical protein
MTSEVGTSDTTRPIPRIADQFWFDRSAAMVESSIAAYNDAASKLQALIGWLWAAYIVVAGARLTLDMTRGVFASVGYIGAALTLIAAYSLSVKAQMPVAAAFDPRDPDEIRDVYFAAVHTKRRWLFATIVSAGIALVILTVSLLFAPAVRSGNRSLTVTTVGARNYLTVEADEPTHVLLEVRSGGKDTFGRMLVLSGSPPTATLSIPTSLIPRQVSVRWNSGDGSEIAITEDLPRTAP